MLILKFRELLLRERLGTDASIGMALVLLTSATVWVHGGWEDWSFLAPLNQRATTSLLYQPLSPTPQEGWVKGREIPPSGTVHPACCCPQRQTPGPSNSSGGKKPEVTELSYLRCFTLGSGQSRSKHILFSCYFHSLWCSWCCFHPVYSYRRL